MTHTVEHHSNKQNKDIAPSDSRDRVAGTRVLSRVGVGYPNYNRQISNKERLTTNVNATVNKRLQEVREFHRQKRGEDLPLNANTIYLAYAAQKTRLEDEELTGDMTLSQLLSELVAKSVLLGPATTEALKSRRYHKNKLVLAEHNDTIRDIVSSVNPHDLPEITAVIQEQCIGISNAIKQPSLVSRKGYIEGLVRGARAEIAVENALLNDNRLDVRIPNDEEDDLAGIDMVVNRITDGKAANFDVKSGGSYIGRIKEILKLGDEDKLELSNIEQIYYYTGHSKDGNPHYLINADSGKFGDIDTSQNEFTAGGQTHLQQIVHNILDQ